MAWIVALWFRGSDLKMILAQDLNLVARWLGSISTHENKINISHFFFFFFNIANKIKINKMQKNIYIYIYINEYKFFFFFLIFIFFFESVNVSRKHSNLGLTSEFVAPRVRNGARVESWAQLPD
jgi:hypothetical protein